MDFTRIGLIFSGHGFGFNTNILETNINLACYCSCSFGRWRRSAQLIKKKKQLLIIYVKLIIARSSRKTRFKSNYKKLKAKRKRRNKEFLLLNKKKRYVLNKLRKMQIVSSRKTRYNSFATKTIEQISQQIVSLAIEQVRVKLQTKASARFHISVNSFKSALLKFCTTKSLKTQFTLIFLILVYRVYNKIIIYFIKLWDFKMN
jgi:hypothetical protein